MNRAITFTEKLYLAGEKIAPPFAIQIVIEGVGDLLLEDLVRAVVKASDVCPGTKLKLQGNKWVSGDRYPRVSEIKKENLESSLREKLRPKEAVALEVLLARDEGNQVDLVFRVLHSVMDGRGALLWIEEVFRALRDEKLIGAPSFDTETNFLENAPIVHERKKLKLNFSSPINLRRGEIDGPLFIRKTLIGNHSGLVSKLSVMLTNEAFGATSLFMIPVDLRRHPMNGTSLSNLSLPLFLECKKGETWEMVHEKLLSLLKNNLEISKDGMEGWISSIPLNILTTGLRLLVKFQQKTGLFPATSLLSHLGRVEYKTFSSPHFQMKTMYSIPVYIPLAPLSFVAVDCGDHTELLVSSPSGAEVTRQLEALMDKIEKSFNNENIKTWRGNETAIPYQKEKTIVDLFCEQVIKNPHRTALLDHGKEISYQLLHQQSDMVAHDLVNQGVGPGDVVSIFLERNYYSLYAILGILKAGAAFLPIDTELPKERISYLIKDSKSVICITQAKFIKDFSDNELVKIYQIEDCEKEREFISFAHKKREKNNLAYIIYTSGSTGMPKGVCVGHQSLTNYLEWAKGYYQVQADSRFAFFTSLAFDLSLTSFLLPLISGGSVALFSESLNHHLLHHMLMESGVNSLKLTPTHLELLTKLRIKAFGFKIVIVGGEQFKRSTALSSQDIFGEECRIINEYGPTEATVGCMVYEFKATLEFAAVPIGLPINNVQIYLLNGAHEFVTQDEIGEIYIAGDSLALGYLNNNELMNEKFILINNSKGHKVRAYRTGDLARLRNGVIEYIGRNDEQLKINGRRIEPGEIEIILETIPIISKAAVFFREHPESHEKVLYAYFMTEGNFNEHEARDYLTLHLPSYMVPTFLIKIEKWPLTINGKIDVQKLPVAWEQSQKAVEESVWGLDELERRVGRIWSTLLNISIDHINLDSNFNELGGDSLKMIEMLSTVSNEVVKKGRESFFVEEVKVIIRTPTLQNVCSLVRHSNS
jgi:amino acid adenylation domain-containing protein